MKAFTCNFILRIFMEKGRKMKCFHFVQAFVIVHVCLKIDRFSNNEDDKNLIIYLWLNFCYQNLILYFII